MFPLRWYNEKGNHLCDILPQNPQPQYIYEKTSAKLTSRGILQKTWTLFFRMFEVMKDKEDHKNGPRLENLKNHDN